MFTKLLRSDHHDVEFKHALFAKLYEQFGINAEVVHTTQKVPLLRAEIQANEKYATEIINLQDATKNIYDINLVLRVHSCYRGLRYSYQKLNNIEGNDETLTLLGQAFEKFLIDIEQLHISNIDLKIKAYNAHLHNLEGNIQAYFATFLKKNILNNLPFSQDNKNPKKILKKYLAHLRYLSSVLDQTLGLQIVLDDTPNRITTTYTATPVTEKTTIQKRRIQSEQTPRDFIEWANLQFRSLLVQSSTELPGLCRLTHLHTLKNCFLIHAKVESENETHEWSYSRSASLVYAGEKKYSENEHKESVRENIAQLRIALASNGDLPIEVIMLTNDFISDFHPEVHISRRTRNYINSENTPNTTVTHLPINLVGTFSRGYYANGDIAPLTYGDKSKRTRQTAQHAVNNLNEKHIHIHCATGADRTSCIDTLLNIELQRRAYSEILGFDVNSVDIERMYRFSLFPAMLGHLIRAGSFGMKPKTKTSNWQGIPFILSGLRKLHYNPTHDIFSSETNDAFYWDISETNRLRPINNDTFHKLIQEDQLPAPIESKAEVEETPCYDFASLFNNIDTKSEDYTWLWASLLILLSLLLIIVGIIFVVPSGGSSALVAGLAFLGLEIALEYSAALAIGITTMLVGAAGATASVGWMCFHYIQKTQPAIEHAEYTELEDDSVELYF